MIKHLGRIHAETIAEKKRKSKEKKAAGYSAATMSKGWRVRGCYGAKTNDRNVIIEAVAATCNERDGVENIPKTKRKGLMRKAERETCAAWRIKKDKGKWEERKKERIERKIYDTFDYN